MLEASLDALKSESMTPIKLRQVWHCNQCGFEWLPKTKARPERCPSRKCRSVAWDRPKLREKLKTGPKPKGKTKGQPSKQRKGKR